MPDVHLVVSPEGLSVRQVAERLCFSWRKVEYLCRDGRIIGARKHPLTKKWWIYPPGIVMQGPGRWR
jgi:hypothetical protein